MTAKAFPMRAPEQQRLLVVDRESLTTATVGQALRRAGFEVTTTAAVSDAVEKARELRHSLAIMDFAMFEAAGTELASEVRNLGVPLIFLNACGAEEVVLRAIDAGAAGYFFKPVDPAQIVPAVHVALRRARELATLVAETERLRSAAEANSDIGVAVGLLMAQRALPRRAAFETLRQHARRTRQRLCQVASDITAIVSKLYEVPTVLPDTVRNPTTVRGERR